MAICITRFELLKQEIITYYTRIFFAVDHISMSKGRVAIDALNSFRINLGTHNRQNKNKTQRTRKHKIITKNLEKNIIKINFF